MAGASHQARRALCGRRAPRSVARLVAPPMSQALGQQVVVDNKAGAAGMLGSDAVAKAKDGYTLGIGTVSTHAIGPALMRQPPYRPDADFAQIGVVGTTPLAVFVHPGVATTLAELADKARREPGRLQFRLAGQRLARPSCRRLVQHADRWRPGARTVSRQRPGSAGPAGRRVHVLFDNIPTALSQVQSGSVARSPSRHRRVLRSCRTCRRSAKPACPTSRS